MGDISCLNISTCYEVPSVSDGLSLLKSTLSQKRASSLAEYCLSSAAGCEHTEQIEPGVTKHCEIVHIMFKTMDELSIQLRNLNSGVLGVIVHLDGDCAHEQFHLGCTFSSHLNHHCRIVSILARLQDLSVPVCSLVKGKLTTNGMIIALASDVRLGSTDANFDFATVNISNPFFGPKILRFLSKFNWSL